MSNKPLHWVIQKNIANEQRTQNLIETMIEQEIPHTLVNCVPFSHQLQPEPEITGPVIVNGSTKLIKMAIARKWSPGVWYNDNFRHEVWTQHLSEFMLNGDAKITTFGELQLTEDAFVRPCEDLKLFSGMVVRSQELPWWKKDRLGQNAELTRETLVAYSKPKSIEAEYRLFVVNGKIISGSRYQYRGRLKESDFVDPDAIDFAEKVLSIWMPHVNCVVDIADCYDHFKVIEFNCLNGSGFYHSDIRAIVREITTNFNSGL